MHALFVSLLVIATSEIGDKTQLLALVLAARYQKPLAIVLGILLATLANHLIAALLGQWFGVLINATVLRWLLGLSFLAAAVWVLFPDKLSEESVSIKKDRGVFITTLISFFLAEMGDKTQVATLVLAAHFQSLIYVVIGTTLGMLLANVPAVFLGKAFAKHIPIRLFHVIAGIVFAILGIVQFYNLR